jgi:hypothetical protein
MEVVGIDPEVRSQIYKLASICLCPNTSGQVLVRKLIEISSKLQTPQKKIS